MRAGSIARDVRWGVAGGLFCAAFYAVVAVGLFALSGGGALGRRGLTLPGVLLGYVLAGVAGGALVGLLRPLTRTQPGAALVGLVAGVVAIPAGGAAVYGPPAQWGAAQWVVLPVFGLVGGALAGSYFWEPPAGAPEPPGRQKGRRRRRAP